MKKRLSVVALVIVLAIAGGITMVWAADPGTQNDPLISKSYIDQVLLPQVYGYIDKAIAAVSPSQTSAPPTVAATFEVISVKAGQKLMGKKGCEMILRMGTGKVIASVRGGLADVTGGVDIGEGMPMPANHLLIVPLEDGRGIAAQTDMLVMVRGGYEIKE